MEYDQMPCLVDRMVKYMSQTQLSDESQDNDTSKSKRTASNSGNSLKNKISTIKEKAKKDIANLKENQVPLKHKIRGKVYEINRRIKALKTAIEQNNAQITELKNNPDDSMIPAKYAIKIKKLDNQNHNAVIKVLEDILIDYNNSIEELDRQFNEKVAVINTKAEKQIEAERSNDVKRKQQQAVKLKAKAQAAQKAKRDARQKAKENERESSLAILRQHLPIDQSAPITDLANMPKELSGLVQMLNQKFQIVNDAELVSKLVRAKTVNKYFSMIRQAMVDAIGGDTPADLLVVSFKELRPNEYDFILHTFKNRRIEHLATQYGMVKQPNSANLCLPINLNAEQKEAVLKDLEMFFNDLNQKGLCTHIFDAQHNVLFKAV